MFVIGKSDSYSWPVTVEFPVDNGKMETQSFTARLKRLPQTKLEEIELAMVNEKMSDREVAKEVLVGWEDVVDANSKEIPFSDTAKDQLLDHALVAGAIVRALHESLRGGKRKN